MVQRDEMLSMMSGTTVLFAIVLDELSKTGALSKEGFADILRAAAKDAEERQPDELRRLRRLDLRMFRNLADLLVKPRSQWQPIVIEGGKRDDGKDG